MSCHIRFIIENRVNTPWYSHRFLFILDSTIKERRVSTLINISLDVAFFGLLNLLEKCLSLFKELKGSLRLSLSSWDCFTSLFIHLLEEQVKLVLFGCFCFDQLLDAIKIHRGWQGSDCSSSERIRVRSDTDGRLRSDWLLWLLDWRLFLNPCWNFNVGDWPSLGRNNTILRPLRAAWTRAWLWPRWSTSLFWLTLFSLLFSFVLTCWWRCLSLRFLVLSFNILMSYFDTLKLFLEVCHELLIRNFWLFVALFIEWIFNFLLFYICQLIFCHRHSDWAWLSVKAFIEFLRLRHWWKLILQPFLKIVFFFLKTVLFWL